MNLLDRVMSRFLSALALPLAAVGCGGGRQYPDQDTIVALLVTVVAAGALVGWRRTRRRATARVDEARQDAEKALTWSASLEQLVRFGQALASALDRESLQRAVANHLPDLVGQRSCWILVRVEGRWEPLHIDMADAAQRDRMERLADDVVENVGNSRGILSERGTQLCVALLAGSTTVGVLGVVRRSPAVDDAFRQRLVAASSLLGIAIKNVQLIDEIRDHGLYDGLTRCFNRTHGLEVVEAEMRRARRTGSPLSVVLFDVDHFKNINDRHGHLCGDAVLAGVGRRMRETLRTSDIRCRYGGEEFLVVLPQTPLTGAERVAEQLRTRIAEAGTPCGGENVHVTISLGVVAARPNEIDPEGIIGRADQALYEAKRRGRNRMYVSVDSERGEPAVG